MGAVQRVRAAIRRFLGGLARKEHSLATSALIGLIIWTLTRLVNSIATSGTIEYDIDISSDTLRDGTAASLIEVELTNLSTDTTKVTDLKVVIADPDNKTIFSTAKGDSHCAYESYVWVGSEAECDPHPDGMMFVAPLLLPGTSVRAGIKFTQRADATHDPIVRIGPGVTSEVRFVESGVQTFVARHEAALLLTLLAIALFFFVLSVATSEREPRP
jgi:hypothetical protein